MIFAIVMRRSPCLPEYLKAAQERLGYLAVTTMLSLYSQVHRRCSKMLPDGSTPSFGVL